MSLALCLLRRLVCHSEPPLPVPPPPAPSWPPPLPPPPLFLWLSVLTAIYAVVVTSVSLDCISYVSACREVLLGTICARYRSCLLLYSIFYGMHDLMDVTAVPIDVFLLLHILLIIDRIHVASSID